MSEWKDGYRSDGHVYIDVEHAMFHYEFPMGYLEYLVERDIIPFLYKNEQVWIQDAALISLFKKYMDTGELPGSYLSWLERQN